MEEMRQYLQQLDALSIRLSSLSGLVCVLMHSIQSIEMNYKTEYYNALCFLSDSITETEHSLHQLTTNLFDAFRSWKEQINGQRTT